MVGCLPGPPGWSICPFVVIFEAGLRGNATTVNCPATLKEAHYSSQPVRVRATTAESAQTASSPCEDHQRRICWI